MNWEQEALRLLYLEGRLLDDRRFDEWLTLYTEDCEYWVPAWHGEEILTADPSTELSLMYYRNRHGLEDRVFRVKTGTSAASMPLPRTCHLVTNALFEKRQEALCATANWHTNVWRKENLQIYTGYADYTFRQEDKLKIAKKKVVLINDLIDTVVDFYMI